MQKSNILPIESFIKKRKEIMRSLPPVSLRISDQNETFYNYNSGKDGLREAYHLTPLNGTLISQYQDMNSRNEMTRNTVSTTTNKKAKLKLYGDISRVRSKN
jgi:hypothetical protein